MMEFLKVDGHEMEDHSSLLKYYEKLANTEVHR
jgi:2-hydroxy-3-oxopropionate reductase